MFRRGIFAICFVLCVSSVHAGISTSTRVRRQLITYNSVVATPFGLNPIPFGSVVSPPWSPLPGFPVYNSVVASPYGLMPIPFGSKITPLGK
ncbi:hypothetical protein AAVH_29320 [Aphelenchoides avenae]|nr:hypothetical protein AAVH_29320 [Aphelenchus avenae]